MSEQPDSSGPDAVPGIAPPTPPAISEEIIVVDGEQFCVGEHRSLGRQHRYTYDWRTGPNEGYGFAAGGPPMSRENHVIAIRTFVAGIDPTSGFLGEPEDERPAP